MLRFHPNREQDVYTATNSDHFPPISRTIRYKKVTKPLLERKRRARINRCLDELKDLVGALGADGENINKLEKADILELTVRHLKKISRLQDPVQEAHRFQAGFTRCANEACTFLFSLPGMNSAIGKHLVEHLKQCISKHNLLYSTPPLTQSRIPEMCSQTLSPSTSPVLGNTSALLVQQQNFQYEQCHHHYRLTGVDLSHLRMKRETSNTENEDSLSSNESINSMWRPW